MIDEPGFLAQLYANPGDDTTRLVYADWLEERGDRRGAYLRQEVELAGLDEWSEGYRDRERELRRLRLGLPADWLELAGRRYDVWLVDLPADPPGLTLLLLTLCRLGRGPLEAAGMLGQLPQAVVENALRPAAEEVRETLLAACQAGEEPPASEVPVRLRPARAPRPKLCRYPGPGDAPGYALRLVERTRKKRPALEDAVRRVLGGGEDAGAAVEGGWPPARCRWSSARGSTGSAPRRCGWPCRPAPGSRSAKKRLLERYVMSIEEGFLAQLAAHPEDDDTRRVYADWLEERADRRGEYLRLEIEYAGLGEDDPRRAELEGRLRGLRVPIEPGWLARAGKRFDVWLLGYPPAGKIAVIKVIRELTECGLAEAKQLSETLPALVLGDRCLADAERARDGLRRRLLPPGYPPPAEATALIRPSPSPAPQTYQVWLLSFEPVNKIFVIRAVREVSGCGLAEAKNLVEGPLPALVYQCADGRRLDLARRAFGGHAEVEIRPLQP
jgi:uncharacterized protein (TIGR02996 family)